MSLIVDSPYSWIDFRGTSLKRSAKLLYFNDITKCLL